VFLNRHFSQRIALIASDEVPRREFLLGPTRYNERGERIARHFHEQHIPTVRIGDSRDVSRVFVAPRFKRPYVKNVDEGIPFLGNSSMLALRLPCDYLLAKSFKKLPSLMLHGGEVLLSCSGTIGVSVLCGESYAGFALSQHAARIYAIPEFRGYLHAFLSSEIGRDLALQQNYGKVIKELTEDQIKNVAVPLLSGSTMRSINYKMTRAAVSVDKARKLLTDAEATLQSELSEVDNVHAVHLLPRSPIKPRGIPNNAAYILA
jgi:type I restriction enzyme S subunit